jgi:DNA-nicking Smr family endonuclease
MKIKFTLNKPVKTEDENFFQQAVGKVKPLKVDTIHFDKKVSKLKTKIQLKNTGKSNKKALAQFHFSDEFEPNLNTQGPMKYVRQDVSSFEAKNLRRSVYSPDLILDLHGLDQQEAKQEIAALLYACQKEHAQCVCIIHGLGSRVLKNKVPHWLVQHPDVMAFHQAPLEWGGNGALLALIELKDKFNKT